MLKVNNLKSGYEKGFSLKGISFEVLKFDFLGIIGPNGSGKTTLFKTLTGFLNIEGGSIFFEDRNIKKMTRSEIAQNIAIVNQNSEAMPDIMVEEYVLLGRIPKRKKMQFFETKHDMDIVDKVLKLTQTETFRQRRMLSLSGGEKQLVMIARALAQEPKLLLLDEPTNHLDISHQVKLLDLLKKLNHENELTVVLILHDLNLASEYCEKLILLNEGNIKTYGTPSTVLTYQNIEEVYSTTVVVEKNPLSNNPLIYYVSEYIKSKVKIK